MPGANKQMGFQQLHVRIQRMLVELTGVIGNIHTVRKMLMSLQQDCEAKLTTEKMADESEYYENMFLNALSSGAYYLKLKLAWTVDS